MARCLVLSVLICSALMQVAYANHKNTGVCYAQVSVQNYTDRDWDIDVTASVGSICNSSNNCDSAEAGEITLTSIKQTTAINPDFFNILSSGDLIINTRVKVTAPYAVNLLSESGWTLYEQHDSVDIRKDDSAGYPSFPFNIKDFIPHLQYPPDPGTASYESIVGGSIQTTFPPPVNSAGKTSGDKLCVNQHRTLYTFAMLPPPQRLVVLKVKFANEAALDRFAPMAKQSVADIDPALIAKLGVINNSHELMSAMNRLQSVELDKADLALLFTFSMVCDQADARCTMQLPAASS